MSVTRKLLLGALMVFAAMALAAPSAFGQIEVKDEPNPGKHCSALIVNDHSGSGGCLLHLVGVPTFTLIAHVQSGELTLAVCTGEFEARINEAGTGHLYNEVLSDVTPGSCFIEPCREIILEAGGTDPQAHGPFELWPLQIKKVGADRMLDVTLCIKPKTEEVEGITCTLHIPITNLAHTYSFNAILDIGCEAPSDELEFRGRWTLENAGEAGHTNIEIVG